MSEQLNGQTDLLDIEPPEEIDPEAPHGRKKDGTPYKRRADWRAKTTATLKQSMTTAQAVNSARPATKSTTPRKKADINYRDGITGLLQIPAFGLGMFAPINPAFGLDSATILLHAPVIASALEQTALNNEQVAAMLDQILTVGPWGALLGALVPLAVQIAANHGLVPAGEESGTLTPEQLMGMVAARQAAAAPSAS